MMFWLREPWRTRMLFASVAANLFCGALIAAHLLRRDNGPPGMSSVVERMARELPSDDAARFRAAMAREAGWQDGARHRMDEARTALSRSILNEPYDEKSVRAHMAALQQTRAELSGRLGDSLVAAVGTLSPEGRARLAEAADRLARK